MKKQLIVSALLVTGTALAFPPYPPIQLPRAACGFVGSDHLGVCYQNKTQQPVKSIKIVVKAGNHVVVNQYAPIPQGEYASEMTSVNDLVGENIKRVSYTLQIGDKVICPEVVLGDADMNQPMHFDLIGDAQSGYRCQLAN